MSDIIKQLLKQQLGSSLYLHSVNTAEFAHKLALKYHLNAEHAYLAGLLHDNAKQFSFESMKEKAARYNGHFDQDELSTPALLHAPLGALLAREVFGVANPDVIQAIRYHTTGAAAMTTFDKIVFLADGLEAERDFPGVEVLREMIFHSLDHCLLLMINHTLAYLRKKHALIHTRTLELHKNLTEIQEKHYDSQSLSHSLRPVSRR